MDMLPMAMIMSNRTTTAQASSALPDAPVVSPTARRPRAARPRAAMARVLERAAQVVAPPASTSCNPAH